MIENCTWEIKDRLLSGWRARLKSCKTSALGLFSRWVPLFPPVSISILSSKVFAVPVLHLGSLHPLSHRMLTVLSVPLHSLHSNFTLVGQPGSSNGYKNIWLQPLLLLLPSAPDGVRFKLTHNRLVTRHACKSRNNYFNSQFIKGVSSFLIQKSCMIKWWIGTMHDEWWVNTRLIFGSLPGCIVLYSKK